MKALSFWQPWCEIILDHGKRIENRERWSGCNYRGPVLIHAAQGYGGALAFTNTCDWLMTQAGLLHEVNRFAEAGFKHWKPKPSTKLGGIVGRAVIDGVIKNERDFAAYGANVRGAEAQRKWWHGGFALVLANVERLPFVPWKGKQGFFEVPDDYATRGQL